jgi:hypothetical protein
MVEMDWHINEDLPNANDDVSLLVLLQNHGQQGVHVGEHGPRILHQACKCQSTIILQ